MFTMIAQLPKDILGIMISGKTTKEDYERLNPIMEQHKQQHETIKLFVELEEFNYSIKALWEDFKFSFKYLGNISAMAIVTDKEWMEEAMEAFGAVMPNLKTKGFEFDERQEALAWLQKQKN